MEVVRVSEMRGGADEKSGAFKAYKKYIIMVN
jgi:hypothetical protein